MFSAKTSVVVAVPPPLSALPKGQYCNEALDGFSRFLVRADLFGIYNRQNYSKAEDKAEQRLRVFLSPWPRGFSSSLIT